MKLNNNQKAFFALVRAGLWESEVRLLPFDSIDFCDVYRIAEEQSVVGLVAAGLEHVVDVKVPQEIALIFVGSALQLEQRNLAMNDFVAKLIEQLRKEDIYAILVKGQGIAQCYERPLWRASGDVDLLLSDANYQRAKQFMLPQAAEVEQEYSTFKHTGMTLKNGFVVELHGSLYSRLSKRIDRGIDALQKDVFCGCNVRSWEDGKTQVFLPGVDEDVMFVFTHILHHYYVEGIGLRQICDWCRLLWTYKDSLNRGLLESRVREMGLMSEWKAFAALAVDWLGMPVDAMPLYSVSRRWSRKGGIILEFVLECGNFGHNRKKTLRKSFLGGKIASVWRKMRDFGRHARVFPWDSVKFFFHFLGDGIKLVTEQR